MSEFAEEIEELLPEGWSTDAETYGINFNLICPHGCVSPLRKMGLI